ncbi:MAG: hypothetical protein V4480_01710 [Patescibacteria group bacterium]
MPDDSPNIDDLSFEEKVSVLVGALPAPVRDFLTSPERDAVSLRLTQKYNLHADQAAAFERAYVYMLLGVDTPDEFVQDLRNAGIGTDTVQGLTNDVNEQVFKRLREQELREPQAAPKAPPASAPTPVEVPVMQVAAAQVQPAPDPLPAPSPTTTPITPAPQPQTQPSYNLVPQTPAPPIPAPSSAPVPEIRTMATDMDVARHPEKYATGTSGQGTMPDVPHPWQTSPAQSFQTASVPYTSMPVESRAIPAPLPVELPAQWKPAETAVQSNSPQGIAAPTLSTPSPSNPPLAKEYSSDPYREQIQ